VGSSRGVAICWVVRACTLQGREHCAGGGCAGRTWRERHTEGLRACWPRASDRSRKKQGIHPTTAHFTGGAPQRQVWLNPAGSMSDGEENGDPPGVEVPGVGGHGSFPPRGGSSGDHRHTSRSPTRRKVVLAVNGRGAGGARGPGNSGQHGPPAGAGCGAESAPRLGARRAPATPGPSGGGGCGGRPAPLRSRTTGRHVRAGREAQLPLCLYLPHWGTCLASYLVVWVGWRRWPILIKGVGPAQRFPPFFGRRATTVRGIVVADK